MTFQVFNYVEANKVAISSVGEITEYYQFVKSNLHTFLRDPAGVLQVAFNYGNDNIRSKAGLLVYNIEDTEKWAWSLHLLLILTTYCRATTWSASYDLGVDEP